MPVSHEAQQVHDASCLVDLHCDLLLTTHFLGWNWGKRHARNPLPGAPLMGHGDLPRFQEGGVGCLALGLVVNPLRKRTGPQAIDRYFDRIDALCAQHPQLVKATTPAAIRTARQQGRIACFAGLEGAHGLNGELDRLPAFRDRGLGYVGLAHFTKNQACCPMVGWGQSSTEALTDHGRALVDELQRLGIVIDVAHVNKPGVMEVCQRAKVPVICSHTACTAIHPSPRGLDDTQIKAIADTGGVLGIIFVTPFIGRGGLDAVAAHLDHIRKLVGVEHCALGSDWDGFALYPKDLSSADQLPGLTQRLLELGWTAEEVHKVYGDNALRVWEDVQAAGLPQEPQAAI